MSTLRAFVSLPKPYRFGSTAQTQPAQRSLIAANEGGEGRCQLEDERHLSAAAETLFAQTSRRPSSVLCRLYCRAGPLSLSTGFTFRQLEHLSLQSILQCIRSTFLQSGLLANGATSVPKHRMSESNPSAPSGECTLIPWKIYIYLLGCQWKPSW